MKYYSAYVYSDDEVEKMDSNKSYIQVNCTGSYWFDVSSHAINNRKKGRNDYLLVYTHSGQSLAHIRGKKHHLKGGSIFFYHPHEEQYYGQVDAQPLWCFWIHFSGYGVSELLKKLRLDRKTTLRTGVNDYLVYEFETMSKTIFHKNNNYEILLSSMMIQLLYTIADLSSSNFPISNSTTTANLMKESLHFLHQNYNKNLSLEELANISGLSIGRYINLFKELTNSTPKRFLTQLRVEKASELLMNTSMSVKEVSLSVGFEDPLYFSRLFKKYKNVTPTEYRLLSQ